MLRGRWQLAILTAWGVLAVIGLVQAPLAGAAEFEFREAFGPDGTTATGFSSAGSVAVDHKEDSVYVLDRDADAVFKFDLEGNPVNFGGSSSNISGNMLSNLSIGGSFRTRQLAVDSASHTFYVTGGEVGGKAQSLLAFQANGEPSPFTEGPGEGTTNAITSESFSLRGVAVDSNGNIYISGVNNGDDVNVYSASGALLLKKIGGSISSPANLAIDSNGKLYVLRNSEEVVGMSPSSYPIISTTTYPTVTSLLQLDPRPVVSIATDLVTNEVYVAEVIEKDGDDFIRVGSYDENGGRTETNIGGPGTEGELKVTDGIAVGAVEQPGIDEPVTQLFAADNPIGGMGGLAQVKIFREVLCICAPVIELTAARSVSSDSAVLRTKISPSNRETTYWFEYGLKDCGTNTCNRIPISGESVGRGRRGVIAEQTLTGLSAETLYHFRVVAENEVDSTQGPDRIFTTQGAGLGFVLSDSRAWEMVSSPRKFGGTLVNMGITAIQSAASGNGLAYASRGPIVEEPTSNRSVDFATALAKRNEDGSWDSTDLTPTHTSAANPDFATPFRIFSPDLLRAEVEPTDDTPLSPQASEQTPYQWSDGSPPSFAPLVNPANVPPGTEFGPQAEGAADPVRVEGASTDVKSIVIRSNVAPLVPDAAGGSIYLWQGGSLGAVSKLPADEGGNVVEGILGSGQGSVRHAVSDDGSRVFWAPTLKYNNAGISLPALYVRDTVAGASVRLDVAESGAGEGESHPAFNIASADGRVVFFTDTEQLTEDASPSGRDLYRCEIGDVGAGLGCVSLIDISAPIEGSGESAEVFDQVSGASDDGTRLYFVARGVLDESSNQEGDLAVAGQPNLYYWQVGKGIQFIATLSEQDYLVWGGFLNRFGFAERISAAASPNGRYFAFTSEKSLTGYENRNSSDQVNSEVFVYDSQGAELSCVSCNPSGAAAVGERVAGNNKFVPADPAALWANRWTAAILPEATVNEQAGRSLHRPRSVLDNGRVFFNGVDPLVPADSNGNWDVYQYEPVGVGSCSANTTTAATTKSGNGCIGLLSSGTANGDAGFLDASESGKDVFFLTPGRLSVLDRDEELDAYDARVDGIEAVLPPLQECAGEACQPSIGPPNDPTPSSESFRGAETPIKCRKGQRKVRRSGRSVCVQKKNKKHGKHQKGNASKSGRAGR